MNEINLIPQDPLTQRLIEDLLYAMFKLELAERAAAMSEFPRPDVATADTPSAQADAQPESTPDTVLCQSGNELENEVNAEQDQKNIENSLVTLGSFDI